MQKKIEKIIIEYADGYDVVEENIDELVELFQELLSFAADHEFQFPDIVMTHIPKYKKQYIQ